MKVFMLFLSLTCFSMDKDSAKLIYQLNNESFSKKEILNNLELCKYQNYLANILDTDLYECSRDKDDTSKGDSKLNKMINVSGKMSKYLNVFDKDSNTSEDGLYENFSVNHDLIYFK